MDPLTIAALALTLVAVAAVAVIATRARALRELLAQTRAGLEAEKSTAVEAVEKLAVALSDRTEARTRLQDSEARTATLTAERDAARGDLDAMRTALAEANQVVAVEAQKRAATEKRLEDWQKAKAEALNHAKAAVLTTAHEVSSKLIADHKRESVAAKKETEERIRKTTADMTKQFEGVAKSVTALHGQVGESRATIDTVWRALSSPAGAGDYSEMALENTLKSFGLERGRDYEVEYTVHDAAEQRRLRPDAIVFLPFDAVLVIDCKASKFLLELAEVEETDREAETLANLAKTMSQHLRRLAAKDYQGQVLDSYRASGRSGEIRRILSVMYLPNETAVEKFRKADPEFERKAAKEQIIVAGPTGLASIIGFARVEIDLGRQAENQEQIVESTQQLLESVGVVLEHVGKVGKGIRVASESFANLTKSINARLLPRSHKLVKLGVRPAKGKPLPNHLAQYQVVDLSEPGLIEGEAEEVEPSAPAALADRTEAAE